MMLFALLCCFVVVACDCNKLDELETELTLMKQWISELQQAVHIQQESSEALKNDFLNYKKEQHLASETAFCAFDSSGRVDYSVGATFPFGEEHLDQGGNFDTSSSTYTCPVNGIYLFSSQNLPEGGTKIEFEIVVGGSSTAGIHSDSSDSSGTTPTATVITRCNQGDTVLVRVVNNTARRWGRINSINVSVFSGTLLAILSN